MQLGRPGKELYHFESPENCYISYSNDPVQWQTDDDSPLSPQKPFLNPTYDLLTRTFTGTIKWDSMIDGTVRWEYTIVLSESLNVVIDGEVKKYDAEDTLRDTSKYLDALVYWRDLRPSDASPYGHIFIQAGRVGLASYHFVHEGEGGTYISYENAPEEWKLDDGSSPPIQKHFLNPQYDAATQTFTGKIDWAPTSFGGDVRWDYTMVFSSTIDKIVQGSVKCFKLDGTTGRELQFGTTRYFHDTLDKVLIYAQYDEAKIEMHAILQARLVSV
eukprot:CAMPEP_0197837216 /NCGR_PEP_ID=MMETSP1437-20131217/31462_1 /TAXON_ID=49252 ORGANISM="Eucampia antarctica, Strain CCMP1452" /NCGR_SAMPLE_ID=MMETSP1437 /ASSEMBLY_ACC=CAM_ASM_001096 /LENGTH=272 /DNA_ID=CAMNT_0043444069 /DNA_START=292 /DNA_END=1110 /DNA_ORIENTATION=+